MTEETKITTCAVACGHCSNRTLMHIVASYEELCEVLDDAGQTWEDGTQYDLLRCPACGKINLRVIEWEEIVRDHVIEQGDNPEEVFASIEYPRPREVPAGLPRKVRRAISEARKVRKVPNAYAVLLGRAIEAVMEDRKASGDDLYQQIIDLRKREEIPEGLAEIAHSVRHFRNRGAHFSGSLTESDVPMAEKFTYALLEWVYSAPHLVRLAKNVSPLQRKKGSTHNKRNKPAGKSTPKTPQIKPK